MIQHMSAFRSIHLSINNMLQLTMLATYDISMNVVIHCTYVQVIIEGNNHSTHTSIYYPLLLYKLHSTKLILSAVQVSDP